MTLHNDISLRNDEADPATSSARDLDPATSAARPGPVRASIVIPTYNGVEVTRACIESLIASGWNDGDELIIVDNASSDDTRRFLATLDGSVRVILNDVNRNFAGACNQGVAVARGTYIVLLNNDTQVTPGWLDAMIVAAESQGADVVGSRLLYPDGRIQHAGIGIERGCFPRHLNRHERGDLPRAATSFECQVVTGACMLVRRDRWNAVGGLDERFRNGCEDIDICLRLRAGGSAVWYCADSVVIHHESLSPGRNDHDEDNKVLLFDRHRDSMRGDRISGDRIVSLADPSLPWRRDTRVTTSIIIPLHDRVDMTRMCIDSIFKAGLPDDAEIVLVDNASTDGTVEYCDEIAGQVRVLRKDTNVNFSGACNFGMAHSLGSKLVFLNNDTQVTEGWLEALTAPLDDPRIGIVGGRLLYPDGRVQHAGVAFGPDRVGFHVNAGAAGDDPAVLQGRTVQAVTGACLAIDREVFLKARFDVTYRNGCEDLELCLRAAQLGVATWYEPSCVVTHHESQSAGRFDHASANLQLFLSRWYNVIVPDVDTFARATTIAASFPVHAHQDAAWPARHALAGESWGTCEAPSAIKLTSSGDVSLASAFGTAVDLSDGNAFVISTGAAGAATVAAVTAQLLEPDAMTGNLPDVAMAWLGEGSEPVLALTRAVLDRVGGIDARLTTPVAAIVDLARRCQLAGYLISDRQPDLALPPVTARLVGATFVGTPDAARWAACWNISSARTTPRAVTTWSPLLPQLAVDPDDLTFATRSRAVLLTWRPAAAAAFTRSARELLTTLTPADDVTLVVRTGTDESAFAAFEQAAEGISDHDLPDIVLVDAEIDHEAALCALSDVVVIPDLGTFSLHSLALAHGARPLSPARALIFLATTDQTRRAA